MKNKILVIVPAYNEEKNISSVIDDLRKNIQTADILVVNDGSADNTGGIAEKKGVFVLNLPDNLGIGAAMQTGYKFAYNMGYDIAVQCDGDGQHPANQIQKLIEPLVEEKYDAVIGSRFLENNNYKSSFSRRVGMKIFSLIISYLLKQEMTDTTSGFRAVNRQVISFFSINYPCDYPEVEALMFLHKADFKIKEVPILMRQRTNGVSSITYSKSAYYMVKVLLAILLDILRKVPSRGEKE